MIHTSPILHTNPRAAISIADLGPAPCPKIHTLRKLGSLCVAPLTWGFVGCHPLLVTLVLKDVECSW